MRRAVSEVPQEDLLWCWNYLRDADDAVDATQEIFIKLCGNVGRFESRSRLSTWVYRIVRNHCLSLAASVAAKRRTQQVMVDELELHDEMLMERMHRAEVRGEIDHLLDRAAAVMKPGEVDAFVLHYRDGLSVKEITKCGSG